MPVRYVSISDAAQPITLNSLLAAPTVIAERFLDMTQNQFVMDQVLRNAGSVPGKAIQFRVSSGIFADAAAEIVNERGEIPLVTVTKGDLQTVPTRGRGLGVGISWDMRDFDVTGEVNRQLRVIRNTIVRDIDGAFLAQLDAAVPGGNVVAAAQPWANSSATVRKNINTARNLIQQALAPGTSGTGAAGSYLGFNPDTLIINPNTQTDLLDSAEFIQMIFGQVNPSYGLSNLSQVPGGNVLGLNPLVTNSCPVGTAYVVESRTVGGYGDAIPLSMSELYDWAPSRKSRADAYRDTAAFIDEPFAAGKITGI